MITQQVVQKVIAVADRAKTARDYKTANRAFIALLYAFLEGRLKEGAAHLEYETDGGDPYFDLMVIVTGEARLCIPRPLIRKEVYVKFMAKAAVVERLRHCRSHGEPAEFSAEFETFGMYVPEEWLLTEEQQENVSLWMTPEEMAEFCPEQGQDSAAEDDDDEDEWLYAIQDSLS